GPYYPNWDQDVTALEKNYRDADPSRVRAELAEWAEQLASRFDSVAGDQWQRAGYRSDGAAFTVDSFARYLLHDPVHHLWDIGIDPR
ncbi:MAG: DinB family protein, partial [Acidimicrobiia bacterium]